MWLFSLYVRRQYFGFIIVLFVQFAMGLNMPAKTVVFTAVKKWDGDSHRFIGSGEYIQVSEDYCAFLPA